MIKKRMLLTIMILFSFKVNSNDECKLPERIFFDMVDEGGISKFNFRPFIDSMYLDIEDPKTTTKILDIEFNKLEALDAAYKIYKLFYSRIGYKRRIEDVQTNNLLIENEENNAKIDTIEQKIQDPYGSKVDAAHLDKLNMIIAGTSSQKGLVDYLILPAEYKSGWLWTTTTKYFLSPNNDFLNASLNYVYLYALSFLIKDEQQKSKFLGCMYTLYSNNLTGKIEALKGFCDDDAKQNAKIGIQSIFITINSSMQDKIQEQPLSLEQSKESLSLVSTSLNSLANLKFIS